MVPWMSSARSSTGMASHSSTVARPEGRERATDDDAPIGEAYRTQQTCAGGVTAYRTTEAGRHAVEWGDWTRGRLPRERPGRTSAGRRPRPRHVSPPSGHRRLAGRMAPLERRVLAHCSAAPTEPLGGAPAHGRLE